MTTATHDHHQTDGPLHVPPIDVSPIRRVSLIAAAVGFGAFLVLGFINLGTSKETGSKDFFLAYLVGWVFWAAIPFGAMALMMIAYLTTASWGVVLRRAFQAATRTMWLTGALLLPIIISLFLSASPYWWSDKTWEGKPEEVALAKHLRVEAVEEAQHKIHDYLNPSFFILRAVVIFGVLGTIVMVLNKWSRPAEDHDDEKAKYNLHAISGPGIIIWGIILTFGITDWVMSVEPTWASSMFPVVYGMNAFICTVSIGVLVFYTLNQDKPEVLGIVKDKFRIDIGTVLFGFTMLWAYASFCQYMLIWAGNLPEEVTYYRKRGDHGWELLAYVLMAVHWLLPFFIFLFREVKTNPKAMRRMAILLLSVCAADVVWWLVPAIEHEEGFLHTPMAFAALVGIGGVWGLVFSRELGKRPILPANSETRFLAAWGQHH